MLHRFFLLLFCVKFMCQFLFVFYIFISFGRPKQIKIINKDKKFIGKGGILLGIVINKAAAAAFM